MLYVFPTRTVRSAAMPTRCSAMSICCRRLGLLKSRLDTSKHVDLSLVREAGARIR
jgi:hypothetical protein